MPRAERLSTRLDSLLEAVFESPSDPFALYWDITAHITPDEIAQAQRTLRRRLRQKGPLATETSILVACLMNLGGFRPLRILHFLSLYVPGGIRLSLFELAVEAIFLGEPPVPPSVLYDLTQYTYLEKRLLVRKSSEISEELAESLDPRVLLFLYLLALRDDLSNEHVQLIALVLKRSVPSRELRGRIGSASLEEFGEIARAVKTAEERSLELELGASSATRAGRSFNRDSASFFLDKYFSDEAIAEARASAPEIPKRPLAPRPVQKESPPAPAAATPRGRKETGLSEPAPAPRHSRPMDAAPAARIRKPSSGDDTSPREESGGEPSRQRARSAPSGARSSRRSATASDVSPAASSSASPAARSPARSAARRGSGLVALPTVLAAVVLAILLGVVPAGLRSPAPAARTAQSADSAAAAPAVRAEPPAAAPTAAPSPAGSTASPAAAPGAPAEPPTVTYVVKPGDSLWKIFTSMQAGAGNGRGWLDFLSRTRSANDLGDPDQLKPGRVLTLSAPR